MGGQTSNENPKGGDTPELLWKEIKTDIDTLKGLLKQVDQAGTLSENTEHRLGQTFSQIENRINTLQKQFTDPLSVSQLEELSKFFLNIEWDLTDIKKDSNWDVIPSISEHIRTHMDSWENFPRVQGGGQKRPSRDEEKDALRKKIKKTERNLRMIERKLQMVS